MHYRPDIDGLRAVAVLGVVLCHAGVALSGGYVGVDVFFVISGYLIGRLLLKEAEAGGVSIVDFWERRIRRILPALAVVTAACLVAGWFILVPPTYHLLGRAVVNLAILKSNLFYANQTDYFAPTVDELPLLHTWSLAVEEQFYLFVPVLFALLVRLRRSWLVPTIAVAAALSLAAAVYGVEQGNPTAYFHLATRAWELLAGMLVALWRPRFVPTSSRLRETIALLAAACIVLPCVLYNERTPFPGLAALPPVVGTMVLIAMGGDGATLSTIHKLLASAAARGVGLISYSLYLWHWPVIVFYKYHRLAVPTTVERWALIGVSWLLAVATYYLIEQPFRRRDLLATRGKLFGAAAATFALLVGSGEVLKKFNGATGRLPPQALALPSASFCDYARREVDEPGLPEKLVALGDDGPQPNLLIWGDSHAIVLLPAIDELCRANGTSARCAAAFGRPPLLDNVAARSDEEKTTSAALGAALLDYVRRHKTRDVLLAACWGRYERHTGFTESLMQTIDALQAAGCRVTFMKAVPTYPFDVRTALMRFAWHDRPPTGLSLRRGEYEAHNRLQAAILRELPARGVAVIDPLPTLLARGGSSEFVPFDDGGVLYGDSNHLTLYGARALKPALEPLVTELAAEPPTSIRR